LTISFRFGTISVCDRQARDDSNCGAVQSVVRVKITAMQSHLLQCMSTMECRDAARDSRGGDRFHHKC